MVYIMGYELENVRGNIVLFEADFIVNASNTKLILGSGVSMAFKRHCGLRLQQEMDDVRKQFMQLQTPIQQGDVVATSSGDATNFKYALHAAVINYNKSVSQASRKPSLKTIEAILLNAEPYLQWFSEKFNKIPTVIFPYLGCGVGGLNRIEVQGLFEAFAQREIKFNAIIKLCKYVNE